MSIYVTKGLYSAIKVLCYVTILFSIVLQSLLIGLVKHLLCQITLFKSTMASKLIFCIALLDYTWWTTCNVYVWIIWNPLWTRALWNVSQHSSDLQSLLQRQCNFTLSSTEAIKITTSFFGHFYSARLTNHLLIALNDFFSVPMWDYLLKPCRLHSQGIQLFIALLSQQSMLSSCWA